MPADFRIECFEFNNQQTGRPDGATIFILCFFLQTGRSYGALKSRR